MELSIACTLSAGDGAARMRRWSALSSLGRPAVRRAGHVLEVGYALDAAGLAELDALAAAERECCAFVSWTVTRDGERTVLRVAAEPERPDDIDAIVALFGVE